MAEPYFHGLLDEIPNITHGFESVQKIEVTFERDEWAIARVTADGTTGRYPLTVRPGGLFIDPSKELPPD